MTVHVTTTESMRWLVLDLDTVFTVGGVHGRGEEPLGHRRDGGRLRIDLGRDVPRGEPVQVTIPYQGRPKVSEASQETWADGFFWRRTADGQPWVSVVSVLDGADIWWPAKDHPSDEPDSLALHVTVPEPLVVAANGTLRGVDENSDGTTTHHWFVSTPINNYGVIVNVAPYRRLETIFTSVTGEAFPFQFWVLPEDVERGRVLFEEMQDHMRYFERLLGPYPFRRDKYGVAQTPFLGMENQSIISYGATFEPNEFGFDYLHFHELAHEWWANRLTAPDWNDWWMHEGFATYMEALYAEELEGEVAYHRRMAQAREGIQNRMPLAPRETQASREIYLGGAGLYRKGAWVLHTLRYLMGKDALLETFRLLHVEPENDDTGCGCRFVTTEDFRRTAEEVSGRDLERFFEVYLRVAELPELISVRDGNTLSLRWRVPDGGNFALPVDVSVDGVVRRVSLDAGPVRLSVPETAVIEIDPLGWLLRR